jgi:hypothetical protein
MKRQITTWPWDEIERVRVTQATVELRGSRTLVRINRAAVEGMHQLEREIYGRVAPDKVWGR